MAADTVPNSRGFGFRRETVPVLNTELLFRWFAKGFDADLVCDVGSYDGQHALRFLKCGKKIVALEANPENYRALRADQKVASAGIDVYPLAAWNKDGKIDFHVVRVPNANLDPRRSKISSIRTRNDNRFSSFTVEVEARRLDTFVSQIEMHECESIALWIDVEGAAYQVLEGIAGIRQRVSVVHVETETQPFWRDQDLWPDVERLMRVNGFRPVARSGDRFQFDVLFVNEEFRRSRLITTNLLMLLARARRKGGLILRAFRSIAR